MRVLVTRPRADAERTARQLAARGHEAVLAPVLTITATGERPPAGPFDAIVLTSANGVPALASLGGSVETLPVFAVGERTGSVAREAGFGDVRPAAGDAASLARLIAGTGSPGARLLLVVGRDRKPEPEAGLAAAGFDLATWTAYEALAAERLPQDVDRALREGRLDAALHYSRRSANVLLGLAAHAQATAGFLDIIQVCLSADTAAPLLGAGARRVSVARSPDENALLKALDEAPDKYGQAGSRGSPSR